MNSIAALTNAISTALGTFAPLFFIAWFIYEVYRRQSGKVKLSFFQWLKTDNQGKRVIKSTIIVLFFYILVNTLIVFYLV